MSDNNTTSNVGKKVAQVLIGKFEAQRVLTRGVNTTLFRGKAGVDMMSGQKVYAKRPTQFKAIETVDGDISGQHNAIGVGNVSAEVQQFITVPIDIPNLEHATELNQLQELLSPASEEVIHRLESNIGRLMIENAGLSYGSPGTAITKWSDVTGAGALMSSVGVPMGMGNVNYAMNSFSNANLADAQNSLTAADGLVRTAWQEAQISSRFGGLNAISSNALESYTAGASADRAGALGATPDATWVTHKDTMIQTLALTGLTISTTGAVKPGDIITFTGSGALARSYINVKNRTVAMGSAGVPINWSCTVVTGGNTDGSGDVVVTVTNAAIFGTTGLNSQFQNISAALTSGDVFTIEGAADTTYQPAIAYHRDAVALASVSLPKLFATDTIATTKDGLTLRITRYSDGEKNLNKWRVDLLPVLGVINPLYMAKCFGV